jgi:hypothetical protein
MALTHNVELVWVDKNDPSVRYKPIIKEYSIDGSNQRYNFEEIN